MGTVLILISSQQHSAMVLSRWDGDADREDGRIRSCLAYVRLIERYINVPPFDGMCSV